MSLNTFGNRDDTSIKLRTQNQQILSKEQTKLLEMETQKMAERLMELKIAMSHEKEEREKTFRGGGFWHSGQAGSLGSYPKEVVSKAMKPKEQNAKQKITWLKNEPIVLPERARGPCTIACIAERKLPSDKSSNLKFKGRRCGQCEEKAAHVNCTECGEDYCAACFTAFHLKGALKKHRSTPIGSGGLRTPRADVTRIPKDDYKENVQQTFGDRKNEKISTSTVTDSDLRRMGNVSKGDLKEITASSKSTPVQWQGNFSDDGGSLLEGTYDPIANQRQFQEALLEWRQGGKARENGENKPAQAKKTPRADVSVETATDGITRQPIDIKFSSHSLSYAERLMLKKHRRMELGTLSGPPSPSLASAANEASVNDQRDRLHGSSDRNKFQREDADAFSEDGRKSRLSEADSEGSSHRKTLDGFLASSRSQLNNSFVADSSRMKNDLGQMSPVNRKACSARLPSERQKVTPAATRIRPDESKLSIVELTKPLSKKDIIGLERSTTYHVIEIPDPVSVRKTPKPPANRRISSRPKVRKDAFLSPSGSLDLSIQPRPPRKPLVVTQSSVEAFDAPRKISSSSKDTDASVSMKDSLNSKPNAENLSSRGNLNASKTRLNSAKTSTARPVSSRLKEKSGKDEVELAESVSGVEDEHETRSQAGSRAKEVPGSRAASKCGKDAKQGRLDRQRTDSAMNPRIKPRVASRPGSQMTSRQSQRPKSQAGSRPSSRLTSHRDGCLTKVASEGLCSVARLSEASATSQCTDLGAYFTMAVHPDRREVMTPASIRLNSARPNGRWKVSNTLYQMAPRSWKPDTSLVETVSEDQVQQIVREGQHFTVEATTETSSLPKDTTLNWPLSQGLSSANLPDNSNRVAAEEPEPSGGKKKNSDLEISYKKVTHSEVKSDSKPELESLPKEEALNDVKLKFVQGHSVTPNMMIPARFRRPGSSASVRDSQSGLRTGRDSQCGSRTGRESQCGSRTGRESQCGSMTGRESQMIVYDGDELSVYDEQNFAEQQQENDAEATKRLDSEIASETGLMAADVKGMHSEFQVRDEADFAKLSKSSHEDISTKFHKLRESQLMSDFEEMEAKIMDNYEEEVKALK